MIPDELDEATPIPVIHLWDMLLVPLQGDVTDTQASALMEATLDKIARCGSRSLVVDASGLTLVDSHLCALLADLAGAASLMGARTILAGLNAAVAQTLLAMDIHLPGVEMVMNLEQAFERLGVRQRCSRSSLAAQLLDEMLADQGSSSLALQEAS